MEVSNHLLVFLHLFSELLNFFEQFFEFVVIKVVELMYFQLDYLFAQFAVFLHQLLELAVFLFWLGFLRGMALPKDSGLWLELLEAIA